MTLSKTIPVTFTKSMIAMVLALSPLLCFAVDINLVGLSNDKALLVVDGSPPKMYAVGSTIGGNTKLIAVDKRTATFITDGKQHTLLIGQAAQRSNVAKSDSASVTMQADERGHFTVSGRINGGSSLQMLVDTGATMVSIPASDAKRLGINYKKGRMGRANTANGPVPVYLVQLDSLKVGDVELFQVDALIQEEGLPIVLLGMSFLKRLSMVREGQQMVLTKKS